MEAESIRPLYESRMFGAMYGNQTHLMLVCNQPPKSFSQHGHNWGEVEIRTPSSGSQPKDCIQTVRPHDYIINLKIWWTVGESNPAFYGASVANYRNSYSPLSRLLPFLIRLAFRLIGQGTNRAAVAVTILYSKIGCSYERIGHGGEFRNLDLWFPKPALCL